MAGSVSEAGCQTAACRVPQPQRSNRGCRTSTTSDFRLLGDLKGVIYLDAKILHGRFQLGVSQEQLHGTQVFGAPIDQRRLGPSHRVGPVVGAVQTEFIDPVAEYPCVLPRTEVW